MDVTGPIEHSIASQKVKHRFFQWTTKWCYGNVDQITEKPDVSNVVCLLQALGCQLREYEKRDDQGDELKSNSMRIVLECGSSRMRAVLELDDVNCQCLRPEDARDASLWSVCGTAPTASCDSINKFEETGSNLLPSVSKDDRAMIRDVLYRLLNTINSKGDNPNRDSTLNLSISKNLERSPSPMDKSESFTRALTQPEIYRVREGNRGMSTLTQIAPSDRRLSMSVQNIVNLPLITRAPSTPTTPLFERQKTWDLDTKGDAEPRPSPPKISSSPVVLSDLCSSLGQVSLQSEDENLSLAECLRRIKFYADKAQNFYGRISPGPDQDKVFLKPSIVKPKASPGRVYSRPSSVCSSPASLSTKSTTSKPLARRSIGAPLTAKQMAVPKTTPTMLPPRRKSIGSALQPGMKLPVANAQKNVSTQKRAVNKPTPTSSSSSLSSTDSRVLLSAKRRISPDPKGQSPLATKPGLPHLKILTPKPPGGIHKTLSAIPVGGLGQKVGTPGASPRSVSPNALGRKGAIGASKFAPVKKDK
ncbi:collagen alpha-1(XXVII) chain [Diachasma alloeum]|uniref:collagen alpha-1(XXVII) chain n=1 Tax=Diachasma alloeum TaxID=454923 RepID=UPI0007382431|nr:collagen alpha-1(XXVII) chain [Diachasma alloeum]